MNIRHLEIFIKVYETQSITQASRILHIAQPAVSFAIKELEKEYNVLLFERMHQRIYPTTHATKLYQYAISIQELIHKTNDAMNDNITTIKVGSSIMLGIHYLPNYITQFSKSNPNCSFMLQVQSATTIESMLLKGELDLGLIETSPANVDLTAIPFLQDEMVIVAKKRKLKEPFDLSLYPLCLREVGSAQRSVIDAYFNLHHIQPNIFMESISVEAMIACVKQDLAVAILPYKLVEQELLQDNIEIFHFKEKMVRTLYIIHHRQKYMTPTLLNFINMIKII